jgi:hypothetical protein
MERELGGHIDPVDLQQFIRAYWERLSALAHAR